MRAVVRFSRALGVPPPVPDFLGLAVRALDAYGRGRHQDLLLASCLPGVAGMYAPWPAASFFGATFTSLLPYRGPRGRVLVGARVDGSSRGRADALAELVERAERRDVRIRLVVAGARGRWREIGLLEVDGRLPNEEAEALRFHPLRSGGDLRPTGVLNRLRGPAYVGSQRGRASRRSTASVAQPKRSAPTGSPDRGL